MLGFLLLLGDRTVQHGGRRFATFLVSRHAQQAVAHSIPPFPRHLRWPGLLP